MERIAKSMLVAAVAGRALGAPAVRCSTTGPNIISNSGFEDSPTSITPWTVVNGTHYSLVRGLFPNTQALSVLLADTPIGDQPGFSQQVNIPCIGEYLLTFDYRFNKTGTTDYGFVVSALGGNSGLDLYKQQGDGSYNFYNEYYSSTTLPAQNEVGFTAYPPVHEQDVNSVIFDNVFLFQAGKPIVKSGATEKVNNGGFESDSLAPWTSLAQSNFTIASPGLSGSKYALRVDPSVPDSTIMQTVTLKKGSHYVFSFEYTYPKKPTDDSFLLLTLNTDGGKAQSFKGSVGTYFGFDRVHKGAGTFSRRFVAHGSETRISLNFNYGLFNTSAWAPILVDNISIKEVKVPIPSSAR